MNTGDATPGQDNEPTPERSAVSQLYQKLKDELRREEHVRGDGYYRPLEIPGAGKAILHDKLDYMHRDMAVLPDGDTREAILREGTPILSVELQTPHQPSYHLFRPCDLKPNAGIVSLFHTALEEAGVGLDSTDPVICIQDSSAAQLLTISITPQGTALAELL